MTSYFRNTETALLRVTNDSLLNMNNQRVTLLIRLLDLSAAVDIIDNNNIFISYIKYTNITPPANSKANRGRWCVDDLRFITNS